MHANVQGSVNVWFYVCKYVAFNEYMKFYMNSIELWIYMRMKYEYMGSLCDIDETNSGIHMK